MPSDELTRHRFVLYVDVDLVGDEPPPPPEDIEADAMHGGLSDYYGVTISAQHDEPKQPVRLVRGGLTDRIFAVTRWEDDPSRGPDAWRAIEKHDVTDEFNELAQRLSYGSLTSG